jgi:hypothetical protein
MARRLPLKADLSMGGASRGASAGKSTRVTKAKTAAKKSLAKAEANLKNEKSSRKSHQRIKGDSDNRPKARASKNNKRINANPNDRSGEVAATKRIRAKRAANPAAYRKVETDSARNEYPAGTTRSARQVVRAKKAVKSAQSRASGVTGRAGGGRRTFFLGGDS